MLKQTYLDYAAIGYGNKAVRDYISGTGYIKNFYTLPPTLDSVNQMAHLRSREEYDRPALVNALLQQHQRLFSELRLPEVHRNIERLRESSVVTVTTAHQPALFLGPLFVIYKALSAVLAARILNQRSDGFYYVPVFWMGSEDHDKNELNHIHLFGRTLTWNTAQEGAFGRMSTSSLRPWIQEIKNLLGNSPYATQLSQELDDAYLREKTIAAATRRLLYHLLGRFGLVVVDGDDVWLKRRFAPLMEKELTEQFAYQSLSQSNEKFSIHYPLQITPREINLFYLQESSRERILREGNHYRIGENSTPISREQMLGELQHHPEHFSPNVVLRPLYQETVLPDAAIFGGPAEVTYWLQLSAVFAATNRQPPVILPRNALLWIDPVNAERMRKARLSESDLFAPTDDIIKKYLDDQLGHQISLSNELALIHTVFDQTMEKVLEVDASLRGALEADRIRTIKQLEQLEERLRRAAKRKDEAAVQLIHTIKEKLFPAGNWQERHENFITFYSRMGPAFFELLLQHLDPFDFRFLVLTEISEAA
ncbi:MAG: bacillithiol biosynthesis cysteine-adding enzyme BshC [Chitinophagales bacterium]|nr:bacillithiol biosynthesis cysteine-adding enzyme BshC [Chitinophagales bacterium]MDW8393479.1 bacillithiol biosynthesis cysteine-adding enzyme BshC [Chitinophagales bacterium]